MQIITTKHGTVFLDEEHNSYHFVSSWDGKTENFASKVEAEKFCETDEGEQIRYS